MMKNISELRQDVVSGDWVVIATGRSRRPHEFLGEKRIRVRQPKKGCPFDMLHKEAVLLLPDGHIKKNAYAWVQVLPNKYPAFRAADVCAVFQDKGPYHWTAGIGFHEVVVTQDHARSIAQMSDKEVELLLIAYQKRYLVLQEEACVEYVSIFHNHGRLSGATIAHPHSQIIAIPVIPPDVGRSLQGSSRYFEEHHTCVHCMMLKYELSVRERVVYENDHCVALTPYASKTAFELRIFPKAHHARFEEIGDTERLSLAHMLRVALAKLHSGLRNPDYNFFLHTAPTKHAKKFQHYHWHFEIIPKTAIWAGFEIGTGIEISTIAPETAAVFLKKIKIL